MNCTFCGATSPAGSTYCDRCGQRLAAAPGASAPAAPPAPVVGGGVPPAVAPVPAWTPPPTPDVASAPSAPGPAPAPAQGGLRRWWVAAVAAAVVLAAGVGVGLSLGGGEDDDGTASASQGTDPGGATSTPTDESEQPDAPEVGAADDLGLGYPQVDQGCTGEYVVILASTGDPASYRSMLTPALGRSATGQYLVTNQSCSSFNQEVDGNPIYAAFDGPYASLEEACGSRATTMYPDAYVRRLDAAAEGRSYCSCIAEASALPLLNRANAEEADLATRYVVTDVQSILYRVGLNPDQLVGGSFGPATTGWLKTFQRTSGLAPTGSTDYDTWLALQGAVCEEL